MLFGIADGASYCLVSVTIGGGVGLVGRLQHVIVPSLLNTATAMSCCETLTTAPCK